MAVYYNLITNVELRKIIGFRFSATSSVMLLELRFLGTDVHMDQYNRLLKLPDFQAVQCGIIPFSDIICPIKDVS